MSSPTITERVKAEDQNARQRGVFSNPTIFVNGQRSILLSGQPSLHLWRDVLGTELIGISEMEDDGYRASLEEGLLDWHHQSESWFYSRYDESSVAVDDSRDAGIPSVVDGTGQTV